ncbi:MAG: hypothetical protein HQL73_05030 [Magnetococcales bacterium]|nr:hypothetical protein [Magnetococcales bacterium]
MSDCKTGGGGQCQDYDERDRYSGKGNDSDFPTPTQKPADPERERYDKAIKQLCNNRVGSPSSELRNISKAERDQFAATLDRVFPGIKKGEKNTYLRMFDHEGGMKENIGRDKDGKKIVRAMSGGIKSGTLKELVRNKLFKESKETMAGGKLTMVGVAKAYRGYFDYSLKSVGGHQALEALSEKSGNQVFTALVADTLYQQGIAGGATIIRGALEPNSPVKRGVMDAQTWSRLLDVAGNKSRQPELNNMIIRRKFETVGDKISTGDVGRFKSFCHQGI